MEKTWGEKMNEVPWGEINRKVSTIDYSGYFTSRYFLFWFLLMAMIPPIFFIWFPLQVYFFFFHWPDHQTSAGESLTDRNRDDGSSPSFNADTDKKDIEEEEKDSWWNLDEASVVGQDVADDEWWKRI
jgi:hypothetical protein